MKWLRIVFSIFVLLELVDCFWIIEIILFKEVVVVWKVGLLRMVDSWLWIVSLEMVRK